MIHAAVRPGGGSTVKVRPTGRRKEVLSRDPTLLEISPGPAGGALELSVHLFVYGTLSFPEVMRAVTGRRFESRAAVLRGYRRRMLQGRVYPGIRPAPADSTDGLVYLSLDPAALACLDDFEGEEYERRRVAVGLDRGILIAEAYVVRAPASGLLTALHWDADRFAASHLRRYVERCHRLRVARARFPRTPRRIG
jgi:gamma-glutamylcyclotransferase (GGCT)/AIG2-like uncharacterized protein YtfP